MTPKPHGRAPSQAAHPLARAATGRWLGLLARHGWALAALAGVLLYLPTLRYEFTYDDTEIIIQNSRIRGLRAPARYLATSWWNHPGAQREYRPAPMASFALNYAAGGLRPAPYHAVNIALHGGACALVWLLVAGLFGRPRAALVAALIFAAHPIHIEAVAGVVGRAELMVTVFFLAALICAHASRREGGWRRRLAWAGLTFLLTALASFSKEHGVMLLPAVAALSLIPPKSGGGEAGGSPFSRELIRRRLARLAPALAAAALAIALYFVTRKLVLGAFVRPEGDRINALDNPIASMDGLPRLLSAVAVIARYGVALAAPFWPSPDYSLRAIPPILSPDDPAWLPGFLMLALGVAGIYLLRRRPAPLLGLILLGVTFLVGSNLLFSIGTIMAERLLYLPSAGFCVALGALAPEAGEPAPSRGRRAALWAMGVWALALVAQHGRYLPVWHDDDRLFSYMVQRVPESARAHAARAKMLGNAGRPTEAIDEARRSLAIYPDYVDAAAFLGVQLCLAGDEAEGRRFLEQAIAVGPVYVKANYFLAHLMTRDGQAGQAEAIMRKGVRDTNGGAMARMFYGIWLSEQKRWREAAAHLEAGLAYALPKDWPDGARALARCYIELGRTDQASKLIQGLTRANPKDDRTRLLEARLLIVSGKSGEARAILRELLSLAPLARETFAQTPVQPEARALLQGLDKH